LIKMERKMRVWETRMANQDRSIRRELLNLIRTKKSGYKVRR